MGDGSVVNPWEVTIGPLGGWLVESGWLTTRKPGVKRSFVDLKIAPKNEKLAEIWRQVLSFSRFVEKSPAVSKIIFGCLSAGSSSRQHQENHADNTNETFTDFNRCHYHQHFPNLSNNIDMGIPEGW